MDYLYSFVQTRFLSRQQTEPYDNPKSIPHFMEQFKHMESSVWQIRLNTPLKALIHHLCHLIWHQWHQWKHTTPGKPYMVVHATITGRNRLRLKINLVRGTLSEIEIVRSMYCQTVLNREIQRLSLLAKYDHTLRRIQTAQRCRYKCSTKWYSSFTLMTTFPKTMIKTLKPLNLQTCLTQARSRKNHTVRP